LDSKGPGGIWDAHNYQQPNNLPVAPEKKKLKPDQEKRW